MADEDLAISAYRVRDEIRYERDGTPIPKKVVTFYLGKHGPFTESFDPATFGATEVNARAEALRAQLRLFR